LAQRQHFEFEIALLLPALQPTVHWNVPDKECAWKVRVCATKAGLVMRAIKQRVWMGVGWRESVFEIRVFVQKVLLVQRVTLWPAQVQTVPLVLERAFATHVAFACVMRVLTVRIVPLLKPSPHVKEIPNGHYAHNPAHPHVLSCPPQPQQQPHLNLNPNLSASQPHSCQQQPNLQQLV